MTATVPCGIIAPVKIRAAWPCSNGSGTHPAGTDATHRQGPGNEPTAYPSIALFEKGGESNGATIA